MAKKKKSMSETADTVFAEEGAPIVDAVEEKQVSQDLANSLVKNVRTARSLRLHNARYNNRNDKPQRT